MHWANECKRWVVCNRRPRHVAEVTKIKRPPNGVEEVPVMLSRLLEAHEFIIEN